MPKGTKTLGNNKAQAWESLGLEHKKRGCACFDTPSYLYQDKTPIHQFTTSYTANDYFCHPPSSWNIELNNNHTKYIFSKKLLNK